MSGGNFRLDEWACIGYQALRGLYTKLCTPAAAQECCNSPLVTSGRGSPSAAWHWGLQRALMNAVLSPNQDGITSIVRISAFSQAGIRTAKQSCRRGLA